MHGDEQKWVDEAIRTNWVSAVGENINVVEREIALYIGIPCAVALSSGTVAFHLAIRLAGERLYGQRCTLISTCDRHMEGKHNGL